MPKQFQLKIADPCHEDWDKMTTTEKGKYCGSCQKQVVDFTGMTDTQLAAYFKKPSSGSLCGRFYGDQLDRKITVPRKEIPWIKYFFQFTLPLFLASCTGNRTKGKVAVETVQKENASEKKECTVTLGALAPPVIEEVETSPICIVGDIGVEDIDSIRFSDTTLTETVEEIWVDGIVAPPDTTIWSGNIELSDKEREKFNNPPADSSLPKAQFIVKVPEPVSIDPKLIFNDEINTVQVNQELKGFLGGFIVRYNSDGEDELDREESEETVIPDLEPAFKMYANPARANSTLYIDAKKAEEGLYAIQLLNLSGQLIRQDQVRMGKGLGVTQFSIPAIPSGNYMVVLLNKKTGKRLTEKLIVQ